MLLIADFTVKKIQIQSDPAFVLLLLDVNWIECVACRASLLVDKKGGRGLDNLVEEIESSMQGVVLTA